MSVRKHWKPRIRNLSAGDTDPHVATVKRKTAPRRRVLTSDIVFPMRRTFLRRYRGFSRQKYGNIPSEYRGNIYDSKAERNYALFLDSEQRKGRIKGWQRQVHFPLIVNGKRIAEVIYDFEVEYESHKEIHEVKGFSTETFKLKEKLFRALYPNQRLKIIKASEVRMR